MARLAATLADGLVSHYRSLEWSRAKMERLFSVDTLVRRDIERVYEGLYLDVVTSFERLVEDLFLGLLTDGIRCTANSIHPRVTFKSYIVARQVVFNGRKFVDWFPYYFTEGRANVFFRDGKPFSLFENPDKKQIEDLMIIRNAIAHKSNYSKNKFESEIIGTLPLTSREKTPAGYLRSRYRTSPTETRYELLVAQIAALARKICI